MTMVNKDEPVVKWRTFTWAIGLLAGMIVACVGWSFAAYQTASDAEKKVLELEIRLNNANHKLELSLNELITNTRNIKETLDKHEQETSGRAASNRTPRY